MSPLEKNILPTPFQSVKRICSDMEKTLNDDSKH